MVEEDTALLVGKMAVDLVPGYTEVGMDFDGQAVEMVILQNEVVKVHHILNFYSKSFSFITISWYHRL